MSAKSARWLIRLLVAGLVSCVALGQQDAAGPPGETLLREYLVLDPVGRSARAVIQTDAVIDAIVRGSFQPPTAGAAVTAPDGSAHTWQAASANEAGVLEHAALGGGYAFATVTREQPAIVWLEASGHSMVYVNGEPRAGDPYSHGWLRLPIALQAGPNTLLFACGRGRLAAKLIEPAKSISFSPYDHTLADFVVGENAPVWAAVPVVNATAEALFGLTIEARCGESAPLRTVVGPILACSARKLGFQMPAPDTFSAESADVSVRLLRADDTELDSIVLKLALRGPREPHRSTFVSAIDGSVQYYAVTPAHPPENHSGPLALFLSLHGASVEATSQAGSYAPKDWGHVVAPTNRRPFGFDWEDWGRLDALEVLDLARQRFEVDPSRTYLTGHSMGGHGTWYLGAVYPDQWAAIAPSAGWTSFTSYVGDDRPSEADPLEALLRRTALQSDTLTMLRNYMPFGIYVLHGDQDDNVPVDQARAMRTQLAQFHPNFAYYERPGAGHWWGAECMDWPPLFRFLRDNVRPAPESVRRVEFVTVNPAVSARCHWVSIDAQEQALAPSSVELSLDAAGRRFFGKTTNVARLELDLNELSRQRERKEGDQTVDATVLKPGEALAIELDGQTLSPVPWPADEPRLWLAKADGAWAVTARPAATYKGSHRSGPFRQAFNHRFLLVYGTQGGVAENAWALNKARYDAETFGYRGNGSLDVLADTVFDPTAELDRNVILYGNANTNAAWTRLLQGCPARVENGRVALGDRTLTGDDMACLFVWPRPGSERALVGVVSGSGVPGMRLTERLPYFVSGVHLPDFCVLGVEMLLNGATGVRAAGFFGNDWSAERGEFVWR